MLTPLWWWALGRSRWAPRLVGSDSGSLFSAIETKTTIYEKLNSTQNEANNETKNIIMPRFEKKSRRNKGKRVGV